MARGPRNLRVAADGIGLTQFGGVALIEQFFQRIHLQCALWRHVRFPQRNNRYSISESLKALLYPLILAWGESKGNTQDCWEGSYHPGHTHVSTITIPLLERAFAKLPEPIREV